MRDDQFDCVPKALLARVDELSVTYDHQKLGSIGYVRQALVSCFVGVKQLTFKAYNKSEFDPAEGYLTHKSASLLETLRIDVPVDLTVQLEERLANCQNLKSYSLNAYNMGPKVDLTKWKVLETF